MSTKNFTPQLWASKIMYDLEATLVGQQITTQDYLGEIKRMGDSITFAGLADPTISDYSGTIASYEDLQDAGLTMYVDQAKSYAFKIDSIDEHRSPVDLQSGHAKRAAYKLREACDSYILGLYSKIPTATATATLTSANIFSNIGAMQQALAEENVPESDMWMVLPPWMRLKLQLAGIKFQISDGVEGGNKGGAWAFTDDLGFRIYVTNQVPNTGTVGTPVSQVMSGSYSAIGFAQQILNTEIIDKHPDFFGKALRGLHVFGSKIIKPKLVKRGVFTYAAESTI